MYRPSAPIEKAEGSITLKANTITLGSSLKVQGATLTAKAFDSVTPGLGKWLVTLAAWLFAPGIDDSSIRALIDGATGLRDQLREYEFQSYLMPITDRYGFHIEFPELPRNWPLTTPGDYENYIARLRGFAAYAAGHIELMREGMRKSITVPGVIMQRYHEPLEAQIVDDPDKSLLFAPLREFPALVPAEDHERLRQYAAARMRGSGVQSRWLAVGTTGDRRIIGTRS